MEIIEIHNESDFNDKISRKQFVDFLYENLQEWGDERHAIEKSVDYAFSDSEGKGGFLLAGFYDGELAGTLIMNNTGMSEYIPENIIVYVATHPDIRGKGVGKQLVLEGIKIADTDVKLHVEYENPAKGFYEYLGFTTKYAEMRFKKK